MRLLFLSFVTCSSPSLFLLVLHYLAPEEEAIASKPCARYINQFYCSDISLQIDSRKRRKTNRIICPSTFLRFMKVTRGQHIEAGGREERGSQLTWREEGSSLLAWRRQERRSVLAWRRGDKESLLSWRRSRLEDGRCHMCRVSSAQRCLRGAGRWQEMDQPGSCYAGATNHWKKTLLCKSSSKDLPNLPGRRSWNGCCGAGPQPCPGLAGLHKGKSWTPPTHSLTVNAGGADDGDGACLAWPQRQLGDDSCVKAFNGGLENH